MPTSYERTFENRALYLPAISYTYAAFVQTDEPIRGTELTARDLDFLNPASRLFYYPCGLLSAGQVRTLADRTRAPVMARDRDATVLLGDSGGFQVQTDRLPFDPETTPLDVLRWLETNATYSMGLDFPTGRLNKGNMVPHRRRLEASGYAPRIDEMCAENRQSRDFNAALLQTVLNNDLMVRERRPGATMMLNVLQGRTEAESKAWFEAVRHYPFEGWAFASGHVRNFALLIRRLLELRDAGLLERCRWIHILGTSRPELAVLYTHLQRKLREQCGNPNLQISFDSATPFHVAAMHEVYGVFLRDRRGWVPGSAKLVLPNDEQRHSEPMLLEAWLKSRCPEAALPLHTDIARIVLDKDVIVRARDPGGRKHQSGWDRLSGYIVMNHNVQAMVEAVRLAHQAFDEGWEDVPTSVIKLEIAINKLFDASSPHTAVDEWAPVLQHYITD